MHKFDKYLVYAGSGQYGDVYEAMWKRHNLQVAIKTLRASIMTVWSGRVIDCFWLRGSVYGICNSVFDFRKHILIQTPKINVVGKGWTISLATVPF